MFVPPASNPLELELDEIEEHALDSELKEKAFVHFTVDWESPDHWESNCVHYNIIPKADTLAFNYYLDFCYQKFRWWNKRKK